MFFFHKVLEEINKWTFDVFKLHDLTQGHPLLAVTYTILQVGVCWCCCGSCCCCCCCCCRCCCCCCCCCSCYCFVWVFFNWMSKVIQGCIVFPLLHFVICLEISCHPLWARCWSKTNRKSSLQALQAHSDSVTRAAKLSRFEPANNVSVREELERGPQGFETHTDLSLARNARLRVLKNWFLTGVRKKSVCPLITFKWAGPWPGEYFAIVLSSKSKYLKTLADFKLWFFAGQRFIKNIQDKTHYVY